MILPPQSSPGMGNPLDMASGGRTLTGATPTNDQSVLNPPMLGMQSPQLQMSPQIQQLISYFHGLGGIPGGAGGMPSAPTGGGVSGQIPGRESYYNGSPPSLGNYAADRSRYYNGFPPQ